MISNLEKENEIRLSSKNTQINRGGESRGKEYNTEIL